MANGWVRIDRKILDNWIWKDKPFTYGQAWIDLILLANHKTHKSMHKGKMVEFRRGDVNQSISFLADRWGWDRRKVRRFIVNMESDGMLTAKVTTNGTTLSLVKYDDYQFSCTTDGTTDGTTHGTTDGTQTIKNKNDKRMNNNMLTYPKQNDYDFDELERLALNERRRN